MEYIVICLVSILTTIYFYKDNHSSEKAKLESEIKLLREQTTKIIQTGISVDFHHSELAKKSSEIARQNVEYATLLAKHQEVIGKQKSEQVRLGLVSENVLPFLSNFKYDKSRVRGLFNPVDLIVFMDNEIVFVEIKTGNAKLSQKQVNIKKLVNSGKCRFEVHRLNEDGYSVEQ